MIPRRDLMKASRTLTWIAALCFCVASVLSLGPQARAQSTTDGAIGGTVMDPSGAAVPHASITAKNIATGASATGSTDDGGRYQIIHLQPGVYSVEVSASGFA